MYYSHVAIAHNKSIAAVAAFNKQMIIDLRNIDCLELLKTLPDKSIDLMVQDLPYGTTKLQWDKAPDLSVMWVEWERVIKDNGAMIFTASQPFTTDLIVSNRKLFRYEIIWKKTQVNGFLDANRKPLKSHENILVFYKKQPTYNPIKTQTNISSLRINKMGSKRAASHYNAFKNPKTVGNEDGSRFPISIIEFSNWNGVIFGDTTNAVIHPTQKPVNLFRYLIRTFSNENEIVFDGYSGSGTTAVACYLEKRKFIGAELNKEFYEKSIKRIEDAQLQTSLF